MFDDMELLLAVDLGVKTGLSLYSSDGRLLWFRSHNFGNASRLRKAVPKFLSEDEELRYLVVEGGGPLAKIWTLEAERRNLEVVGVMAEEWRRIMMFDREQRKGTIAKSNALVYAYRVIDKLADHKATSLNYDAAESILIGLWGMMKVGWIKEVDWILR